MSLMSWIAAYATLPGYLERSAASLIVSISVDDTVQFQIAAVSPLVDWLTRIAGRLGRVVKSGATSGYLRSMRQYVQRNMGFE